MDRVFAICREGRVSQYMQALKSGVADMFTAPIDDAAFRRRSVRQLEKLGVVKKSGEAQ
ncbi:MAG: hypothetical protein PHD67_08435 [Oscillospiraceae bacterium]|nr:hypothetical protein [Oscillospiraceae bacterium]